MKTPLSILWLAALGPLTAADPESVVRFANGDQLSGQIASLDTGVLAWEATVFERPAPFFLKQVLDITLTGEAPAVKADHEATVTLTRGDVVRGQLIAANDKTVALDTWYAGRLEFNRLMVESIRIDEPAALLYRGPTSLDGWVRTEEDKAWTYNRLAFVSKGPGSIARPALLPEECVVTFDAEWKADAFGLKLVLFSDDAEDSSPSSGYELSFQRGSVFLRNCRSNQGFIGNSHSSALAESGRISVEVRASRKTGRISLHVNKRIIDVWSDPDFARGKFGDALHFISQNTMPIRISRIGVAAWDGQVSDLPEPRPGMMRHWGIGGPREIPRTSPKKEIREGRMELANGDSIEGEVMSIDNGTITVKTPLGEVRLPVSRLRTISLPKVDPEEAIRKEGDVHAWFPDGGRITFRLDSLADGKITGFSQNFGTATFSLPAFSRIEFNIYDPDLEEKRSSESW
jgi:hypothetical protein